MFVSLNHAGLATLLPTFWVAVTVSVSFPPDVRPHWSRPASCGSTSLRCGSGLKYGEACGSKASVVGAALEARQDVQSVLVPGCVHVKREL